jgi:hypothetical protein
MWWPRKYIILKTRSSPIASPYNREDEGTPTSKNTIRSTARFTPPSTYYSSPKKSTIYITSWASFSPTSFSSTRSFSKVCSSHYPSSKSTNSTSSSATFSSTSSFSEVSSHYPYSSKFTNRTNSSTLFSSTCSFSKVSSSHYLSSSKSTKCSEEAGCQCGRTQQRS